MDERIDHVISELKTAAEHTKRHIRQAKRVLATDGFPLAKPHERAQTA